MKRILLTLLLVSCNPDRVGPPSPTQIADLDICHLSSAQNTWEGGWQAYYDRKLNFCYLGRWDGTQSAYGISIPCSLLDSCGN